MLDAESDISETSSDIMTTLELDFEVKPVLNSLDDDFWAYFR